MTILTPKEAAEFLGIKPSTLHKYQREGQFDGVFFRVGRRVLFINKHVMSMLLRGMCVSTRQAEIQEINEMLGI